MVKSNLVSSHESDAYRALAIWSARGRVASTSIPCSLPPQRMGARDGIELRAPSRGHVLLHRASKGVGSPF